MDIVQEGAYKAMQKAGSLQEERFSGTWVYRIMINTAKKVVNGFKSGTCFRKTVNLLQ